ncbi:hypothetical protein I6E29_03585 [Arcanobacterium haemolyticum]|nr:hypothetical protein [Arcanobacterium haemolyticum]
MVPQHSQTSAWRRYHRDIRRCAFRELVAFSTQIEMLRGARRLTAPTLAPNEENRCQHPEKLSQGAGGATAHVRQHEGGRNHDHIRPVNWLLDLPCSWEKSATNVEVEDAA